MELDNHIEYSQQKACFTLRDINEPILKKRTYGSR